jgi:cell division protein FtsZ
MALNLMMTSQREELKPRITVFGVGGAGGNAVNNMIDKRLKASSSWLRTPTRRRCSKAGQCPHPDGRQGDRRVWARAPSPRSAPPRPRKRSRIDRRSSGGRAYVLHHRRHGRRHRHGRCPDHRAGRARTGRADRGRGDQALPVRRQQADAQAEEGIEALQKVVDTLIIIPNQNLFRLANERTTFTEAFAMADDVLYQGVKGVTDLMVRPGLINLDFADVRAVMDEMGKAMMGTGEASGEDRAVQAAEKAIANPLLDEISLNGAKGVLINITGGYDLTLFELDEAANIIREKVDPDANIIVGSTLDTSMEGRIRVSVVATGIDATAANRA